MTDLEFRLLAALRQYRRLGNQTISDAHEVAACHREADELLRLEPEKDNPVERYDAPHRVEHRRFVNRMFRFWE